MRAGYKFALIEMRVVCAQPAQLSLHGSLFSADILFSCSPALASFD